MNKSTDAICPKQSEKPPRGNEAIFQLLFEKSPDGQLSITRVHDTIAAALREGSQRLDWVHRAVDGTDFPVEVLLTHIPILGRKVLHVVWRDITERMQAQEALQ